MSETLLESSRQDLENSKLLAQEKFGEEIITILRKFDGNFGVSENDETSSNRIKFLEERGYDLAFAVLIVVGLGKYAFESAISYPGRLARTILSKKKLNS